MIEALKTLVKTCTVWNEQQKIQVLVWLECVKEIIKDYKIIVEGGHIEVCSVPEENRCIDVLKLNEQAEQFLTEAPEC